MQRAPPPPAGNSTLQGNDSVPTPSRPPREAKEAPAPQKPSVPVPLPPRRPTSTPLAGRFLCESAVTHCMTRILALISGL